jgi:hypothetical protein
MSKYLRSMINRRKKESTTELLWEINKAFDDAAPDSPARASKRGRELYDLVRFNSSESIVPWLRDERKALERILLFAKKHANKDFCSAISDALEGRGRGPMTMTFSRPDGSEYLEVIERDEGDDSEVYQGVDFGTTAVVLSFEREEFEKAILDQVIAASDELNLESSRLKAASDRISSKINAFARKTSAIDIFEKIALAVNPRMLATDYDSFEERKIRGAIPFELTHSIGTPAKERALKARKTKYGPVADTLLSIYEKYDGAELFEHDGQCAFWLTPFSAWSDQHKQAISWAETVTWQDSKEEIPSYLYTAIPFGRIPGDSEVWLLITEGEHAGAVMLSDTDLIEDEPRFQNIEQFLAALYLDCGRILNSGGHVRFHRDEHEYFPIRFEHS